MVPPSLGETEGAEPPCLMLLPFVMSAFGSEHTACNTHICIVFSNYFSNVFNSPRPLPTPLKSIRAPIFSRALILSQVLKISWTEIWDAFSICPMFFQSVNEWPDRKYIAECVFGIVINWQWSHLTLSGPKTGHSLYQRAQHTSMSQKE